MNKAQFLQSQLPSTTVSSVSVPADIRLAEVRTTKEIAIFKDVRTTFVAERDNLDMVLLANGSVRMKYRGALPPGLPNEVTLHPAAILLTVPLSA